MRTCNLAIFVCLCACGIEAFAGETRFPYEAIVQSDEAQARSGPGRKFYPTSRLKTGEKVMVHRHDPGGWYMIAPPPGSFSWIPARYVERIGQNMGSVTANRVVVRVGSQESDIRDVEQGTLNQGDEVRLLGEKTLSTERGSERFYKIAPPPREYRWVMGQYLAPAHQAPVARKRRTVGEEASFEGEQAPSARFEGGIETDDPFKAPIPVGGKPAMGSNEQDYDAAVAQMRAIETAFQNMIRQPTSQWDLDAIEAAYRGLLQQTTSNFVKRDIEIRLVKLERYQSVQRDFQDFVQLTSRTNQRDLELQAQQQSQLAQVSGYRAAGGNDLTAIPVSQGTLQPQSMQPQDVQQPQGMSQPQPQMAPASASQPSPQSFTGAGVIQRVQQPMQGGPQFGLFTPQGRFLTYLWADNVDLNAYVGQSMGLTGPRGPHPQLRAELLIIQQMAPVRLSP